MGAIAIVGMGCRFAGAPDLHAYWQLTLEGRDGFGPPPPDRWDHDAFFSENKRLTDKSYAPNGGFIDDIRSFPALHFGIPPRRVEVMDPQQRFSIEVALQAIEDAGYAPSALPRRTGVFMGVTASEYRELMGARVTAQLMASGAVGDAPEDVEPLARAVSRLVPSRPFTAPGGLANMIAAAVAQELDLHGPAYTTDAACASALVALADAVSALRAGAIDAALAGGVYLCITPSHHIAFSRIGAISASGVCRPFDARADGFVQGDGAGAVLLKRLEDAVRDGDRIYATIEGISVNNDGRGDGPMAPVQAGQSEVIRDAWADARIGAERLGYVEAHGTGTDVGDATEFQGLMDALGADVRRAAIGSSKANVGHTMSAAGVAGLIRAVLAVHHGRIPPMAGFASAKDELGLGASPFRVPTATEAWDDADRVACVSSFGFGGTNGHAVLARGPQRAVATPSQVELVRLSASDDSALRDTARATAAALSDDPRITVAAAARAWMCRPELPARLAIAAATREELIASLAQFADGAPARGTAFGTAGEPPKVALLFPGQGAQRTGMLAGIRDRFPVVAETLDRVARDLDDVLALPLEGLLYPERRAEPVDADTASAQLTHTANCQPALFACGQALWALLQQVGLKPVVATGHSLGEFNAAVASGALSERDGARFTARRGAAMAAVTGDPGAMSAILGSADRVRPLLVDGAVIANLNHPEQVVISGATAAVAETGRAAVAAGMQVTPLDVSHAFHSPVFAELDAASLIDEITLRDGAIPVASCIDPQPWTTPETARTVFERHARSPVDFQGALAQCAAIGADLYLQVGAGGPLASFARRTVGRDARAVLTLAPMDDADGGRGLLETLGWLWVHGCALDLHGVTGDAPVASLPPIHLPREAYWAVKAETQATVHLQQSQNRAPVDTAPQSAQGAAEADVTPASDDGVLDRVIEVLARVSSYPRAAIQPRQRLVDDLGFDSLMVADLATGLADAFPGLGGLPQELLINQPTVQDIVDHVARGGTASVAADEDDRPLSAWAPVWRPTPLPDHPDPYALAGRPALVVGSGPRADAIGNALADLGADVARVSPADAGRAAVARMLVWAAGDGDLQGADPAGALIAALDGQARLGSAPDLILVADADDPRVGGMQGAVRAAAREWPESVCKNVDAVGLTDAQVADRVVEELVTEDRSVDVRWSSDGRAVLGLDPAVPVDLPPLEAGQAVLITGGTRGIGARLGARLARDGMRVLLVGRGEPSDEAAAAIRDGAIHVQADVLDREALIAAVADHLPVHAVVHAAGVLADGPLGQVDPAVGARARAVKIDGWRNAIGAAGPGLQVALGIGSWAGRFGNRHQAHYAAANAQLAALARTRGPVRTVVAEFGPWTDSDMVRTIPAPVRAAMRAEGVDFVGDEPGLDALIDDLQHGVGVVVHGRRLPWTTRARVAKRTLSVQTHPFLADHAIDGVPVLPLAAAADLVAWVAGLPHPFEVDDLTLYAGVAVREPTAITVAIRGERAEIRVGERDALAYTARVRPAGPVDDRAPLQGGAPLQLTVDAFYRDVTFHGPLLAGVRGFAGAGPDFARGTIATGRPSDWIPGTARDAWAIDPLALDSAFQLSAMVAWERFQRAGTPVALGRLVQLRPWPAGTDLSVDVHFDETGPDDDRFAASFWLRDPSGATVAVAEGAVAELRKVRTDTQVEIKREWIDPSSWTAVKDLKLRLEGAKAMGIRNPYFTVHQGTARNVTQVDGRELINYSSYNYIGLSGDPRVVSDVHAAVERYGTSVSASRVASGERPFHVELERELAAAQGAEAALVFTAGHATNVTTIGHLFGPGDLILHDELIHDSALQGIKLSGAGRRAFRHDDPAHLDQLLRELRPHHAKVLIVVEGVYSMDGDICQLPEYVAIKKRHGCLLMVDEAHSFGILGATGCGVAEHYGIDGREIDLWMGTLSKSLASCGGWIAGSEPLVTYLRYTAPGFVYSAGITPANGQAALSSLRLMLAEPWRVQKLQSNARFFHEHLKARGLDTGPAKGGSAVVPVVTGNSFHALMLSQRLIDQGVNVQPIVYPAVADDAARLRFFLSSTHTEAQLEHTAELVSETLRGVRAEFAI